MVENTKIEIKGIIYPNFEQVIIRDMSSEFPNLREMVFLDEMGNTSLDLVLTISELKAIKKAFKYVNILKIDEGE